MNMISTGAFLTEVDASNKQDTLVSKLVSAWEKKNSKTAKAGGVSLMALSLAACGSSDDTSDAVSYTQAQLDAAKAAATAAAEATAATAATAAAAAAATAQTTATAAATAAAEATAATAATAAASAAVTAQAAAVAAVDTSTDDAAAVTLSLRNAAAEAGATGTSTMTDAELIVAIKTANDAAIAAAVDLTTDNTAATNTSVAAVTSFDTLAELVTAYDAAVAPSATTTLSTSVDSINGTTGDDTFTADNTGTDVTSTADSIDGGTGTDTLNIYSDGAAGALPALTSVETVNIYDQDADFTMANTAQASVTSLGLIRGDGDLDATLSTAITTVSLTDIDVHANDSTLAAAATATALSVNTSAVTGGTGDDLDITGAALNTITLTANGTTSLGGLDMPDIETLNIVANANVTLVDDVNTTDAAATMTVSGSGNVDVSALDAGFTTVNAGSLTGTFTAEMGAVTATVLTGGSGNDVITASTTNTFAAANALAVNAGAGTDTLVIAATADINTTADGARYSGFETIQTGDSHAMNLVSGITALNVLANTSETFSAMSATQAANVTMVADNTTSTIFTLSDATGASDSMTLNLVNGTATDGIDVTGLSIDNFETLNVVTSTGDNDTDVNTLAFLANSADEVSAINVTGNMDLELTVIANTLDVIATTIDASGMSGTADFTLAQTANLVTGSTVTGTANADTIALGTTLGSTYNGGAGDDGFTTVLATLVADGTDDTVVNGGVGSDTLTISDDGATMTDNHFTYVTGMENLTYSDGSAISLTVGAAFTAAFTDATITVTSLDDADAFTYAGGLYDEATTISLTAAGVGNAGGEDYTITTGDGADTITITAASLVGQAGDSASIAVTAGGGDDTITIETGTLLATTTSETTTVTGGTGADTITLTTTTSTTVQSAANIVVGAGDSLTTARDTITGFDTADGTNLSMTLDFAGTGAVSDFTNTVDSGTILSHNNSNGLITFDDAAAFSSAIVINSANLSDVLNYLAVNTDTLDVAAFLYDSDSSGSGDATMVFSNGTTDSLVELSSVADVVALTATLTTATDNYVAIA